MTLTAPDGTRVSARGLRTWLVKAAPADARGEVTVALVSDARMRTLNRSYRNKDYATDVLSFPAFAPSELWRGKPAAAPSKLRRGKSFAASELQGDKPASLTSSKMRRGKSASLTRAKPGDRADSMRTERRTVSVSAEAATRSPSMSSHASGDEDHDASYLGDIVIATGVAQRQADEEGHPISTELKVLALHGLLHLLGYDHESDSGEMAKLEARLRRRAGLKQGLISRHAR